MNEATFESRLAGVLERLFPGHLSSQIETQRASRCAWGIAPST
jgi:hypothetical protein